MKEDLTPDPRGRALGKSLRKLLAILAIPMLLTACGYHSPYDLQGEAATNHYIIQASLWKNQTSELGLEGVINQAVHDWLTESNRLRLTSDSDEAQYILEGTIVSIKLPGLSYGNFQHATELRNELTVNYSLKEKASGKVLLNRKNVIKRQPFRVGDDAPHHRTNKEAALAEIADELGEDVYLNVFRTLTRIIRYNNN